jgi:tRNA (mo5U34)-methyltransferase
MNFISPEWQKLLDPYNKDFFGIKKDKRIELWQKILLALPSPLDKTIEMSSEVKIDFDWTPQDSVETKDLLLQLVPWRKGPFLINDVFIDSEWCSHLKWDRFLELNVDLHDKTVLDVGSGNGYYGFRMLGLGAKEVLCLEPNLTHFSQFLAINNFAQSKKIQMLPERLESIEIDKPYFDVIFSMGLLYHQRDPGEHLRLLASHLKKEGRIVIETIVTPEDYEEVLFPSDRYANMPNVWSVHNEIGLEKIILEQGLEIIDSTKAVMTTVKEQRATQWMPFRSFESALEEGNPKKTIEGFPAPLRKFVVITIQSNQL